MRPAGFGGDGGGEQTLRLEQSLRELGSSHKGGAYIMSTSGKASTLHPTRAASFTEHRAAQPPLHQLRAAAGSYEVLTRLRALDRPRASTTTTATGDGGGGVSIVESVVRLAPSVVNTEVVMRLSSGLRQSSLLVHDGLHLGPRRAAGRDADGGAWEFPSVAASFFPTAVGAALFTPANGSAPAQLLAVLVDRAVGVASRAPGELELLIHRSMGQDDGRGLAQAAVDTEQVSTRLAIVWGEATAVARALPRLLFALEAPPLLLRGACADDDAACARWRAAHRPSFSVARPMARAAFPAAFPAAFHVSFRSEWAEAEASPKQEKKVSVRSPSPPSPPPLPPRLLLRVQRVCEPPECGNAAPHAVLHALLSPLSLLGLREVGLSGGALATALATGQTSGGEVGAAASTTRGAARRDGEKLEQGGEARRDGEAELGGEARQNSEEVGVFVSDAAMQLAGTGNTDLSRPKRPATPHRTLLSGDSERRVDPVLAAVVAVAIEVRMFEVLLGSAEAPLAEAWEEGAPPAVKVVTVDTAAGGAWGGWLGAKFAPTRAVEEVEAEAGVEADGRVETAASASAGRSEFSRAAAASAAGRDGAHSESGDGGEGLRAPAPLAAVQLLNEGGTFVLRHATPPAANFNRVAHALAPVLLSTLGILLLAAYRAGARRRTRSRRPKV